MEYNEYVKRWQDELINHGKYIGKTGADGKFGSNTLNASCDLFVEEKETKEEIKEELKEEARMAVCVARNFVNVRAGRDGDYMEFEDIGNVYAGQSVEVLDKELDQQYVKIKWHDGIGYAYNAGGKYFRFAEDEKKVGDKILALLDVIEQISTPIGGENAKYIYGAEGKKITRRYVEARSKVHPEYFTNGRLAMLLKIADECEKNNEWIYPIHYAWDCSGLWWFAANKTKLYGEKEIDSTAAGVYANYCVPIEKSELKAGDLVFYKSSSAGRITHMAVVGQSGVVYEAMSGYTGVVACESVDDRTAVYLPGTYKAGQKFKRSAWTHFGRPKVFI